MFVLFAMFLVIGIVDAKQEQNGLDTDDDLDTEDLDDNDTEDDDDDMVKEQEKLQEKLQECISEGEDCDLEQIQNQVQNQVQNHVQNMNTEEVMEQVRSKAAEKGLKIMPTRASDKAIEVLSGKFESIELIEPTEAGETHRYKVLAKKDVKFLGLFDTEIDVEAEIDAETGEVIKTRGPWWSFLTN